MLPMLNHMFHNFHKAIVYLSPSLPINITLKFPFVSSWHVNTSIISNDPQRAFFSALGASKAFDPEWEVIFAGLPKIGYRP